MGIIHLIFQYLVLRIYILMGYLWARAAKTVALKLASGTHEPDFYNAKLTTARFYFERILPRTLSLAAPINSGADNLMSLDADHFCF